MNTAKAECESSLILGKQQIRQGVCAIGNRNPQESYHRLNPIIYRIRDITVDLITKNSYERNKAQAFRFNYLKVCVPELLRI